MSSSDASAPTAPVVIRIPATAHLAVGFFTLGLFSIVLANPRWFAPLLVIPVVASLLVVRLRTVAERDTVTARNLLGSRTVAWDDIEGLRFSRASWARATLKDGTEVRLPAVTFGTLPRLTAASGGRVPNPYQ
ncbi:PH domain-containing protein [Mycolicibacterium baixiangningiae]|uniref:PH domain-containing protein n=1 Tax=Mycolicibacterium baixiangningiae TaxID=2761578 RepID=UPI001865C75D|nr:PH domain-containing protein [Mycolicibacterium baixiangningiae]